MSSVPSHLEMDLFIEVSPFLFMGFHQSKRNSKVGSPTSRLGFLASSKKGGRILFFWLSRSLIWSWKSFTAKRPTCVGGTCFGSWGALVDFWSCWGAQGVSNKSAFSLFQSDKHSRFLASSKVFPKNPRIQIPRWKFQVADVSIWNHFNLYVLDHWLLGILVSNHHLQTITFFFVDREKHHLDFEMPNHHTLERGKGDFLGPAKHIS